MDQVAPSFLSAASSLFWRIDRRSAAREGPELMTNGTVKFFNDAKGFGFITPDEGGNDAFVHISALEASGMRTLATDQRVSYELQPDRRGRESATNIKAI
jgi:CspA family cold shock protein